MTERTVVRQHVQRARSKAAKASLAAALALSMTPALALASETEGENETGATALTATNNEAVTPEASTNAAALGSVAQYSTEGDANVGIQLLANGAYDLAKIADGKYSGTAYASASDPANTKDDWGIDGYDITVDVTVASGKITKVEVGDYTSLDDENWEYMNKADEGYTNRKTGTTYTGVPAQIEAAGNTSSIDVVTTATISSNAIVAAVDNALQAAYDKQNPAAPSAPEAGTYIMMNIPFAQFYATETAGNSVGVDVFTSATKTKPRNGSLAFGSYHIDDTGSAINGISFPVLVTESAAKNIDWSKYTQLTDQASVTITVTGKGNTTTTTYEGKDALFEAADYAYYQLGDAETLGQDAPANYKELTATEDGTLSFGVTKGKAATKITDEGATFATSTNWGDYELDLSASLNEEGGALAGATIYGVVVNTTDGTGYGMRHVENIWRTTDLAWATGSGASFKNEAKGCTLSYKHYASMMGKTIKSATYLTSNGIFEIAVGGDEGFYVPVKTNDATVATENVTVEVDDASPVLSAEVTLPDGFDPAYQIDGKDVTPLPSVGRVAKTVLFDASGLSLGTHELTVSDKNGTYASISTEFAVETSKVVAKFDADQLKLVAAEGATADELANYVGNIATVTVNGTTYNATGRKGVVKIFNADGTLNLEAASNGTAVFGADGTYEIEIAADGYSVNVQATYVKQGAGDNGGNEGGEQNPEQPSNPNPPANPDQPGSDNGAQNPGGSDGSDGSGNSNGANGSDSSDGSTNGKSDDAKQDGSTAGDDVKQLSKTGDTAPFALATAVATVAGGIAAAAALLRRRVMGE